MKKIYFIPMVCIISLSGIGQLVVDNTVSPQQIVEDVFLSNGIFVANVTFNGGDASIANVQVGAFDSQNANVGLGSGIIMSSGEVSAAVGPNNQSGMTGGIIETYGSFDEDLTALIPGYTVNNWAILEFDFIATGDSLSFQYVFGSEEYLEWVGSSFNDVFGFFISGPGIAGPYSNGGINIASIPGTDLAVSINNLNSTSYSEYYVDNGDGMTEPMMSDETYVQYDGLTVAMNASIGQLVIGETYHIKLAVADAGDGILDSGVFLGGDSFVQVCTEEVEFMPDVCMISSVAAHVNYTEECGHVEIWNDSEMNIEWTDAYYEISTGDVIPATALATYDFTEAGIYTISLVYEVGQFVTHYDLDPILISLTPPATPQITAADGLLELTNWDGTSLIQWYLNGEAIAGANSAEFTAIENGTYFVSVNNGCPIYSADLSVTVGLLENESRPYSIYPNPCEGMFVMSAPGMVQLDVHNAVGQNIMTVMVSGLEQIELHSPGIYTLTISMAGGQLYTERMVVR